MNRVMHISIFCIVCLMVSGSYTKIEAEPEFELKDTPYFTGMPSYKITEASDQEFADYRFYNGRDCTTVEGKKFFRAYTLREGAKGSQRALGRGCAFQ